MLFEVQFANRVNHIEKRIPATCFSESVPIDLSELYKFPLVFLFYVWDNEILNCR
jgi:hypothetical protein